jgi:hypothetical protein
MPGDPEGQSVERPQARTAAGPTQTIGTALPGWAWTTLAGALALIFAASALILRQRRLPKPEALGAGRY